MSDRGDRRASERPFEVDPDPTPESLPLAELRAEEAADPHWLNVPNALTFLGNTFRIGGAAVTYGTVLMLLLYLVTALILKLGFDFLF